MSIRAEVVRLRAENQELRQDVDRLRSAMVAMLAGDQTGAWQGYMAEVERYWREMREREYEWLRRRVHP